MEEGKIAATYDVDVTARDGETVEPPQAKEISELIESALNAAWPDFTFHVSTEITSN